MPRKSEEELKIEAERARRNFYDFFKIAFNVLEPQTQLVDNWHIKYLCDRLQTESYRISNHIRKSKDIIINVPPRSLKSYIVTICWNAWTWIQYPSLQFVTTSYSSELANEHSTKTRTLIESDWYQSFYGEYFNLKDDQNVKSWFDNSKMGSRKATSVGGTTTGKGGNIIIVDDPHKVQEIYSEAARNSVADYWNNTLYSRLNDPKVDLRILIMQRLHEKDLTGVLLNSAPESYDHICIPAEMNESLSPKELSKYYVNGYMFSDRFDDLVLKNTRDSMGTAMYSAQYLQNPTPEDGNIFKREWFKKIAKKEIPENLPVYYWTDSAYGKEESDNSATLVFSVDKGNMYIWHSFAWNLQAPDFIRRYKTMLEQTGYSGSSVCYVEPKASGITLVQTIKRERLSNGDSINIVEDKAPQESKVSRAMAASASLEAGRVYFCDEGTGYDDLVRECLAFPNGQHDDRVDSLTAAIALMPDLNKFSYVSNY